MYKFNIKILILVIVTINLINLRKIKAEVCPKYCICDFYQNFNRADCSFQRLINSNVNVPNRVEILNLNNNDISVLDNSAFEGLPSLLNLTLAYNGIGTIYLDAFTPLQYVEFIDLANNRLEQFDSRIFENCKNLIGVNLSGNKFMSIKNEAILKSSSLLKLNLSNAQINHIYPEIFNELPELRTLDLSDNLLITLNNGAFKSLTKLKYINLNGNRWLCDTDLKMTVEMLKNKGVDVILDACSKFASTKIKEQMFERMVMDPSILMKEEPTELINKTNFELDLIWKNKKRTDCTKQDHNTVCELYDECQRNLNEMLVMKTTNEHDLPKMYTSEDLNIVMLIGICLGIAIVSSVLSIFFCLRGCYLANQKSKRRNHSEYLPRINCLRGAPVPPRIPTNPNPRPPIAPPRMRRVEPRPILNRSLSTPVRQNTTNSGDFATFITRLFERPARNQYRRSINQNVIRSFNTLNNCISQHFRDSPSTPNTEHDTEQLIRQPTQPIGEVNLSRDRWLNAVSIMNASTEQQQQPQTQRELARPETPPPSYSDCIHLEV